MGLLMVVVLVLASLGTNLSLTVSHSEIRVPNSRMWDVGINNEQEDEIQQLRMINRRHMIECPLINREVQITTDVASTLLDEQNVTVTVSGVLRLLDRVWVAMISPSHSSVEDCPLNTLLYEETGDLSDLPLLCHYPVKAAYLKNDPDYLTCKEKKCIPGSCSTCSASLTFHIINIRTDIEFVAFANGFATPCILGRSRPLQFASPNSPLHGHLSSIDSTATSMKVRWVSGSSAPQQVQYGNGMSKTSVVTTFTQKNMCGSILKSPAQDFGWHDPGFIHTAIMTGLQPSTKFTYKYGSDSVGWSEETEFRTPPAGGADELKIIAYGDMGKTPRDATVEHYIQPGAQSVSAALAEEVSSGNFDAIYHIGDISYATGFLVEWDYFLHQITPFASRLPYMTAIGNHERDYIDSGSVYITPDSGGECGVPYETYFPMPTSAFDKPWYSIEQGPVHFTVISTEHDWTPNSEQYNWTNTDMASVNRTRTPWLIFIGHRPMYTSTLAAIVSFDPAFVKSVEPLLVKNQVDLVLVGHVHSYERTCGVYDRKCREIPVKDGNGIDTYDHTKYTAPVHAVIGMAGFSLDSFSPIVSEWSLARIKEFGYSRIHATRNVLNLEFVNSNTRQVEDSFQITRK